MLKWFLILLVACSQANTLNQRRHVFNTQPTQIIWLQVAGLSDEHLAILKFAKMQSSSQIAFEKMSCSGRVWNYNLYDLRPLAHLGFMAQLSGKNNIRGTCEDFNLNPVWDYLHSSGYTSYILESGVKDNQSLDQGKNCASTGQKYLENGSLIRMTQSLEMSNVFHFSEASNIEKGKIYFDKSCREQSCYSGLFNNTQALHQKIKNINSNFMLLIRDFSYYHALKSKQISIAKDHLQEIERVIAYFLDLAQFNSDMLVLVTSSEPVGIEFPVAGKSWSEFDKKGANLTFKHSPLISPLYAYGARAENFCGFMEEAQVMSRLLTSPEKQGLSIPFLNNF